MKASIWYTSKLRIGHKQKNKRRALVDVLLSESAPGVAVRVGEFVDTSYDGHTFPLYYGGQVVSANTGNTLGPCFIGTDAACEFAVAVAHLFDWQGYDGTQQPTSEQLDAMSEALRPIAEKNGKEYDAFIAEHRRKDEALLAANTRAASERRDSDREVQPS